MIWRKLSLSNVVYYEQAELDLDYVGLTVVQGHNRNASVKNRRNGAGKSLLFSPISHLKFGDPVGATRKFKHSLLDQTNSRIAYEFELNEKSYVIEKFRKGQSVKYQISIDGEPQDPRTPTIAEQIIQQLIPYNEEEFYTTQYLDSRRASVLLTGTAAHRHNYFSDLFRLNNFDELRRYFQTELTDLKSQTERRQALIETMAPLTWVRKFNYDQAVQSRSTLRKKIQSIEKDIEQTNRKIIDRELFDQHGHLLDVKYDASRHKALKKMRRQLDQYEAQQPLISKHRKDVERFERELKTATSAIDTTGVDNENDLIEKVWQVIETYEKSTIQYQSAVHEYDRAQKEIKRLNANHEQYVNRSKSLTKPHTSAERLRQRLDDIEDQIEHLTVHEQGGTCELCGSELDAKSARQKIKRLKSQRVELEAELETAIDYDQTIEELAELWSDADARELKRLKRVKKPTEPHIDKRLLELRLERPEPIDTVEKPELDSKSLDKELRYLERASKSQAILDKFGEQIQRGSRYMDLLTLRAYVVQQKRKLDQCHSELKDIEVNIERYKQDSETLSDLELKVRRVNRKLKDVDLLEALVDAYGQKGLKLLVMQNISQKIEQNLNKYAHLLFPEPFTFSITVDSNIFDISATRSDKRTSDIRFLSGAESRAFSLLWAISILPLIPANRRSNMIVLDEFEAGLDEVTRNLLINEFLPALNEIVPHIVFITPYHYEPTSARRVITVVKQGQVSKLEINT